MRHTTIGTLAVIGVASIAALGVQYASAAPRSGTGNEASSGFTSVSNVDYLYSATTTGGTDYVYFDIPNPPNGWYQASFTSNFAPTDTSVAENFTCVLVRDGTVNRAQSTSAWDPNSGWYAAVDGINVIKIDHVHTFQMLCGTLDGSSWSFGDRPLQVNLLRIDSEIAGNLGGGIPKHKGDLNVGHAPLKVGHG